MCVCVAAWARVSGKINLWWLYWITADSQCLRFRFFFSLFIFVVADGTYTIYDAPNGHILYAVLHGMRARLVIGKNRFSTIETFALSLHKLIGLQWLDKLYLMIKIEWDAARRSLMHCLILSDGRWPVWWIFSIFICYLSANCDFPTKITCFRPKKRIEE